MFLTEAQMWHEQNNPDSQIHVLVYGPSDPHCYFYKIVSLTYTTLALIVAIVYKILALIYKTVAPVYKIVALIYKTVATVYKIVALIYKIVALTYSTVPFKLLILTFTSKTISTILPHTFCISASSLFFSVNSRPIIFCLNTIQCTT